MSHSGWIAVDLDGTLARYDGWVSETHIGEPIAPMVERVKGWLSDGLDVRVFTARVYGTHSTREHSATRAAIEDWCAEHIGAVLPITNIKDFSMVELWDDRAIQVIPNTGKRADGK